MSLDRSSQESTDIVVLARNTKGSDKIIGDLHGNNAVLIKLINNLAPNDRLFLVGDLTDRGPESFGVIQTIIQFQKENPGRLHVNRGNHESLCLDAIEGLKNIFETGALEDVESLDDLLTLPQSSKAKKFNRTDFNKIISHVKNGGEWLVVMFLEEIKKGKIKIKEGRVDYAEDSEIKLITEFMRGLPYIIHVSGSDPFNTVHADMPIDDDTLNMKIKKNKLSLTEEEKYHATWEREDFIVSSKVPSYVGHNIIVLGKHDSVRNNGNTINLDVAAYLTNALLVVDHTQKKCELIVMGSLNEKYSSALDHAQKNINETIKKNDEVKVDDFERNTLEIMQSLEKSAIKLNPKLTKNQAIVVPVEDKDDFKENETCKLIQTMKSRGLISSKVEQKYVLEEPIDDVSWKKIMKLIDKKEDFITEKINQKVISYEQLLVLAKKWASSNLSMNDFKNTIIEFKEMNKKIDSLSQLIRGYNDEIKVPFYEINKFSKTARKSVLSQLVKILADMRGNADYIQVINNLSSKTDENERVSSMQTIYQLLASQPLAADNHKLFSYLKESDKDMLSPIFSKKFIEDKIKEEHNFSNVTSNDANNNNARLRRI